MDPRLIIRFILSDPIRKIFAIVFAFGLWFYVAIDNNYQYTKSIKTVYTNLPDSYIVVDSVSAIDVIFKGRGGSLLTVWAAPPKAYLNLKNCRSGKNHIPISDLKIPISFGDVAFDFNNIATTTVILDRKITKTIEITVPVKDSVREGYSLNDILVFDTIKVVGPREILSNLTELMTESLSIRNRNASFSKDLSLIVPSPLMQVSKKVVSVKIEIDTAVEKIFTNIPFKPIYVHGQHIYLDNILLDTLIIKGPKSSITKLEKKDIEVSIQLKDLPTGEYFLPAEVALPKYLKPVYSKPQKFHVKIY